MWFCWHIHTHRIRYRKQFSLFAVSFTSHTLVWGANNLETRAAVMVTMARNSTSMVQQSAPRCIIKFPMNQRTTTVQPQKNVDIEKALAYHKILCNAKSSSTPSFTLPPGNDSKQFCLQWIFYIIFISRTLAFYTWISRWIFRSIHFGFLIWLVGISAAAVCFRP